MKKKIIVSIIMVIIIIGVGFSIFKLSAMTSSQSNNDSKSVISTTIEHILDITNEYEITNSHPGEEKLNYVTHLLNKPLRKVMHFSVYFILSLVLIIYINFLFDNKKYIISLTITLILCISFAFLDEYHQTKVEGRTGQYQDVVIDSAGTTFATLVYGSYYLAYKCGKNSEKEHLEEDNNKEKSTKKLKKDN